MEEEDAKVLRAKDLYNIEEGINKNFKGSSLTQNQFDALVSLGINIGRSSLVNSEFFSDAEKNEKNTELGVIA
ncbi:MAG: glycoside hydrolase family protein [Spirochaetales bacterium]|nr:glycoside hydrolase family protein [Spirochaetales bacterium]